MIDARASVESRVSRETFVLLERYVGLIEKWTQKINLISPGTVSDIWRRHIDDCLQVVELTPDRHANWVDLGSGAGLPGLVAAICLRETTRVTLVESDTRKSTFLLSVISQLGLPARVLTDRIERVVPLNADVLSARALASLDNLMPFIGRHRNKNGVALLSKGESYADELTSVQKNWNVDVTIHPSRTSPGARILEIGSISRV